MTVVSENAKAIRKKTEPREVLDYRIMLFLGFSLLVIVPVSILLILTPVINITLRKQVLNRKNLTKSGKHDKNVLKDTTVFMSVIDLSDRKRTTTATRN
jgi:hypothetical protein